MNVRRTVAGTTLGLAIALTGATAAFADDPTYPPTTPSPTTKGAVLPSVTPSVADTSQSVTPSSLAFTGTDALEWGVAGLVLVAAGTGLVVATRRRGVRA